MIQKKLAYIWTMDCPFLKLWWSANGKDYEITTKSI